MTIATVWNTRFVINTASTTTGNITSTFRTPTRTLSWPLNDKQDDFRENSRRKYVRRTQISSLHWVHWIQSQPEIFVIIIRQPGLSENRRSNQGEIFKKNNIPKHCFFISNHCLKINEEIHTRIEMKIFDLLRDVLGLFVHSHYLLPSISRLDIHDLDQSFRNEYNDCSMSTYKSVLHEWRYKLNKSNVYSPKKTNIRINEKNELSSWS